jgi:hypothetical protein
VTESFQKANDSLSRFGEEHVVVTGDKQRDVQSETPSPLK